MQFNQRSKQVGFITFEKSMNKREWIERAKKEGFFVRIRKGFAELWQPVKS